MISYVESLGRNISQISHRFKFMQWAALCPFWDSSVSAVSLRKHLREREDVAVRKALPSVPGSAPGSGGMALKARAAAGLPRYRLTHAPSAAASHLPPARV